MTAPKRPAAPQQDRSRRTLAELMEAAEEVLREKPFDEATVEEICAAAGYTVGAFYSRFSDKEALLEALEARLLDEVDDELGPYLAADPGDDVSAEAWLRGLLTALAGVYRRRGGTVRALLLRARSDADLRERIAAFNQRVVARGEAALAASLPGEGRGGSDRVRTGIFFTVSALRSATLFEEAAPLRPNLDDDRLCAELARACACYLTC